MRVDVPYGEGSIAVEIDDARVSAVLESNAVNIPNETETLDNAIAGPLASGSLLEFLDGFETMLCIVNDGTRPTPTSRVLEAVERVKPLDMDFMVATGAHRAPTEQEYRQMFGRFYDELHDRIYVHDARVDGDMEYLATSRNGTEIYLNRMFLKYNKVLVISSVEPHYFAGYTGGRKSILPGVAAYRTIEQNHRLAMSPASMALALDGNPVHDDMLDAVAALNDKRIFSIMTVLDSSHRIYAATAGDLDAAFRAAVKRAEDVFVVKIKEKTDIVVAVCRFPLDIDLYQSQKAIENSKLALKDGGVLILVSSCRGGVGDDTFVKLLNASPDHDVILRKIEAGYILGYHKAAKMAELRQRADIYGITDLPDDIVSSTLITPFASLQQALDTALSVKGKDATVLFLLDGAMTVPSLY